MGTGTNGGNFKREVRLMIVTTNVTSGCLRRLDLIHKRVESHKIRLHPHLLLGSLPTDQPVFLLQRLLAFRVPPVSIIILVHVFRKIVSHALKQNNTIRYLQSV